MKNRFYTFLSLLLALVLAASLVLPAFADGDEPAGDEPAGDTTEQKPDDTVYVTGITLNQSDVMLAETKTISLRATLTPATATTRTIEWTSADKTIATVDKDGVVTAVSPGDTQITVKSLGTKAGSPDVTASCWIHVPKIPVEGIRGKTGGVTLNSGDHAELEVLVWPDGKEGGASYLNDQTFFLGIPATDTDPGMPALITWRSDAPSIVSVTPDLTDPRKATVTAAKYLTGQRNVTIIATCRDGDFTASFNVRAEPVVVVTGVTLSESDLYLGPGASATLDAVIAPEGASNQSVTWTCTPDTLATVTADSNNPLHATVKAASGVEGDATVTVQTKDGLYTATCIAHIYKNAVPVQDVLINRDALTVGVGRSYMLAATVTPVNATDKKITWSSSNTAIATVEERTGTVTGVSPGEVQISAKAGGKTSSKPLTVQVSGITITPVNPILPIGGNTAITMYNYGDARSSSGWDWTIGDTDIARINGTTGQVTAIHEGETTITCTNGTYSATCQITVIPSGAGPINARLESGQVNFSSLLTALQDKCRTMTYGDELAYITGLSVPTDQGTLFDHYVAEPDPGAGISSTEMYYANRDLGIPLISDIYFVPRAGYTGFATIQYTGYTLPNARTGARNTYIGTVVVDLADNKTKMLYHCDNGAPVQFHADDFDAFCAASNGRNVRYINFKLPAAGYGTLQYHNTGDDKLFERPVDADTRYYPGAVPLIDEVWFVPAQGLTRNAEVGFTIVDTAGVHIEGTVTIVVGGNDSKPTTASLGFSVDRGSVFDFLSSELAGACQDIRGTELNYIYFTSLPSSTRGTLYYGGSTRVSTGSTHRFYRYESGSGSRTVIDDVYFRAASGTSAPGYTEFQFTGVDMQGDSFEGTVRIVVTSDASAALVYSGESGERISFNREEFTNASYNATGRDVNYIRFTNLPSEDVGKLWYLDDISVTTGESFYYNSGSNRQTIGDLSFVPNKAFTGRTVIPYTGYSTAGKSFTGSLTITVTAPYRPGGSSSDPYGNVTPVTDPTTPLVYRSGGELIRFTPSDFTADAVGKLSYDLSTVALVPPDDAVGRLFTSYTSPLSFVSYGGESVPIWSVNGILFQPRPGFTGTAYLMFRSTDITGKSYSGTIIVHVNSSTSSVYYDDMYGFEWAVRPVDFLSSCYVLNGIGNRRFSPGTYMTKADYILMLSRAFVFPSAGLYSFRDVPETAYYAAAVASAKELKLVEGNKYTYFHPLEPITRQDAGILLYKCLRAADRIPIGNKYVLKNFWDQRLIDDAAAEAMAALVTAGIFQGDSYGRLNPRANLTRAEMAALLYRSIA